MTGRSHSFDTVPGDIGFDTVRGEALYYIGYPPLNALTVNTSSCLTVEPPSSLTGREHGAILVVR